MYDRLFLLLFVIIIVVGFLTISFVLTLIQRGKTKNIQKKLSSEKFEHLKIKFTHTYDFKFNIAGGIPSKAEMYFNDNIILFCPNKKGWFNSFINFSLPLILTKDIEKIEKLIKYYNIFKPDKLRIYDKHNILIVLEFKTWFLTQGTCKINIELLNRADFEKITFLDIVKNQ